MEAKTTFPLLGFGAAQVLICLIYYESTEYGALTLAHVLNLNVILTLYLSLFPVLIV